MGAGHTQPIKKKQLIPLFIVVLVIVFLLLPIGIALAAINNSYFTVGGTANSYYTVGGTAGSYFTMGYSTVTVSTVLVSKTSSSNATATGNITNIGLSTCDIRGIQLGTASGVYTSNWTESGNFTTGTYTETMTGLTPNTTYYYRAEAHDSSGYVYGSELTFYSGFNIDGTVEYPTYGGLSPSNYRLSSCANIQFTAVQTASTTNTTLVMRFAEPMSDLTTWSTAAHSAGCLFFVNLYSDSGIDLYTITSNATLRASLVSNISSILTTYNADGVNIDWETGTMTTALYDSLITDLYATLHPLGKLITLYYSTDKMSYHAMLSTPSVVNSDVATLYLGAYYDWDAPSMETDVNAWVAYGYNTAMISPSVILNGTGSDYGFAGTYSLITDTLSPTYSQCTAVTKTPWQGYTVTGGTLYWQGRSQVADKVNWLQTNGFKGISLFILEYDKLNDQRSLLQTIYEAANPPTIVTNAASLVTTTTARLNGTFTESGGSIDPVTVYWGTTDGGTNAAAWSNNSTPTSPAQPQGTGAFYLDISGLSVGTTYYFNTSVSTSTNTIVWGTTVSFVLLSNITTSAGVSASYLILSWVVPMIAALGVVWICLTLGMSWISIIPSVFMFLLIRLLMITIIK